MILFFASLNFIPLGSYLRRRPRMATTDLLPVSSESFAASNVVANDMHPPPPSMNDYHCFQHLHPDFAAHFQQTPHIPLPLETPLPPSSFDFSSHGVFAGPAGHPLFEGVMAMHQMLGHDLNIDWPDIPPCDQTAYSQQATEVYPHWSSPSNSIIDSTPSPLDESPPHSPDRAPEYAQDGLISPPDSCPPPVVPPPTPSPVSTQVQSESRTSFPLVATHTSTFEQPVVAFQADRQKSEKASSKLDPHAADFIRDKLGEQRWTIFSSRLAERRMTTQKPKSKPDSFKGPSMDSFPADKAGGATVIDFLVKVEVVKGVLRTYVPHPYNPLKSLSHSFAPAPSGQVTLSRSTVLSLSGWSNTQFSYWARRAEAISVLAMHDDRLRTAATALQQRLRRLGLFGSPSSSDPPTSSDSNISSRIDTEESEAEEWARLYVTGKGLDVIIDEVKKRTGVSPFLRGKHSSLDPFGSASVDGAGDNKVAVYMPTFQAEKYVHEVPSAPNSNSNSNRAKSSEADGKKSGKRKAVSPTPTMSTGSARMGSESGESTSSWQDAWSAEDILRFTVPVPSHHTQESPPPAYSAEDPHASFLPSGHALLDSLSPLHSHLNNSNSLSSALHYEYTPPPLPKKRRLAPAPAPPPESSFTEAYAAEALRIYRQQRQAHL
ncbi:hypothetical protein BDY19DRAFT_919608 [Irpex rosettiformis]|uniref:Uncharacterized protein n=1 Tax=Irpex rosettiformis TaxID=378272 RepID=A0ACB8UHS9_9APHY|nr:hypothetical protein BDY19DRAFT_919608 [Irpex rosettiformis]